MSECCKRQIAAFAKKCNPTKKFLDAKTRRSGARRSALRGRLFAAPQKNSNRDHAQFVKQAHGDGEHQHGQHIRRRHYGGEHERARTTYGRCFDNCAVFTQPNSASRNTTTGTSKQSPNAKNIVSTKSR